MVSETILAIPSAISFLFAISLNLPKLDAVRLSSTPFYSEVNIIKVAALAELLDVLNGINA